MKQGVHYEHSYSSVPQASGFCTMLAIEDMLITHVDIIQAFLQGDMLKEECFEGDVYILPPPGYGEDAKYVYHLCALLYSACTSSLAWHKTMTVFMEQQGSRQLASKNHSGASTMQTETRLW